MSAIPFAFVDDEGSIVDEASLAIIEDDQAPLALPPFHDGSLVRAFIHRFEVFEYVIDDGKPSARLRYNGTDRQAASATWATVASGIVAGVTHNGAWMTLAKRRAEASIQQEARS